ncbi:MAG TPA: MscL family protein [Patescibacteria group bacterium]|nr:MscL family protein [Patescibacteria group bacterium]
MIRGFIQFIREQRFISLATAFILGGAVTKVVSALVQDIIQPLIGFIFGSPNGLKTYSFHSLAYGDFLSVFIDFLIDAAVIYFIFKGFKLDRLDTQKPEEKK